MSYTRLLAKSTQHAPMDGQEHIAAFEDPRNSLHRHTIEVMAAAKDLLAHGLQKSLHTLRLPENEAERVHRLIMIACLIHDWGKSSSHFQRMIRKTHPDLRQRLRHEACSALIAWEVPELKRWLLSFLHGEPELLLCIAAAAGHHRKFTEGAESKESDCGDALSCLITHKDFQSTLRLGTRDDLIKTNPPLLMKDFLIKNTLGNTVEIRLKKIIQSWNRCAAQHPDLQRLMPLVKAWVLCADVLGSTIRDNQKRSAFLTSLYLRPDRADLEAIAHLKLAEAPPRPFQQQLATARSPVTLAQAGCGSGKTVGAYLWASQYPGRQLWFTYPTTGTTTQGYKDYLIAHPELYARLEHSRRAVDMEIQGIHTPDEDESGTREVDRLDALRAWGSKVLACTVDTVLGLLQNHRKGFYAWPGLIHSTIIFDEIHSYDVKLFGALIRFIETFPGIPVLLMTASLPEARLRRLKAAVRQTHTCELEVIHGPPALEQLPRYQVANGDPFDAVERALKGGQRVLWVSNTVDRCMEVADHFQGLAKVYHSRFRYEDRVQRHKDVIDAFSDQHRAPVIATTTQVAEMSLDISADLLVTDLAPIPALIQRLGRLNRRTTPERPRPPCFFFVRRPERALPYSEEELTEAETWLSRLGTGYLSQADLVTAWHDSRDEAFPTESQFLDGGALTMPAPLRQSEPSLPVLLEPDAQRLDANRRFAKPDPSIHVSRYAIPMPPPPRPGKPPVWQGWREVDWHRVPPPGQIDYDPLRGAKWKK